MSEQLHTQEPWKWYGMGRILADKKIIADIWNSDNGHISDEEQANAIRIVACVNACAGMDTETLALANAGSPNVSEFFNGWSELHGVIEQRDEIMLALVNLAATAKRYLPEYNENPVIQDADAAIAKVEAKNQICAFDRDRKKINDNELLSSCKELLDLIDLAPEDVPAHEYETIRAGALEQAARAIAKAEAA